MYSVLIVDDEEPVLESYSYLIETAVDDFVVAGTARSGGDAIAIARQSRPDVVLMDIAMPGLDGIDTVAELQRSLPDTLYILSTAYERFDLAQRAIPLQVFAYLVKPVTRKRFVETLFRAKERLDETTSRLQERIEVARRDADIVAEQTAEFIRELPWKAFDLAAWSRYRRTLNLSSEKGRVVVADLPDAGWHPRVVRRLERRHRIIWGTYIDYLLVFVDEHVAADRIDRAFREAAAFAAVDSGYPSDAVDHPDVAPHVRIGVGGEYRYDELYRSCDEALAAVPVSDRSAEQRLARHRELADALLQGIARARSFPDVESAYRALFEDTFASWEFPVAIGRILVVVSRIVEDHERLGAGPPGGFGDPAREAPFLETPAAVDGWARRTLRLVVEAAATDATNRLPQLVRTAVRYVDDHYADPLQLTDVAEHCAVSSGHLSRLLAEHLHLSFNDYLNTVRLKVSQRLLEEGRSAVKEVAYAVGYQSPNYFSRVFRRHFGVTPSEYQEQYRGRT